MEEYLVDPCIVPSLSASIIKSLWSDTPAHAKEAHPRLNPAYRKENDPKFNIGTAGHSLLLEGIDCCAVIRAENYMTKLAKEVRDKAYEEGKIPLLVEQYDRVLEMVFAAQMKLARSELGIHDLLKEGDSELSYFWQEDDTWMRIRPDWISKDRTIQINAKFTGVTENPAVISRMVENMGYDIAASFYSRGVKRVDGPTEHHYYLFVIETTPPYESCLIGFPPVYLEMGRGKVDYAIKKWRECMMTGVWKGYPDRVCYPDPTPWGLTAWQDRELQEEYKL
jgi:hypothetical protein